MLGGVGGVFVFGFLLLRGFAVCLLGPPAPLARAQELMSSIRALVYRYFVNSLGLA